MPSIREVIGLPDLTASTKDSVLVIIDAQDEYKFGPLTASDYKEVNVAIADLLQKYRQNKGNIIHVVHNTGIHQSPVFSPEGQLTKEMDEVMAADGEGIVEKKHAGSFSETNLKALVDATGLRKVVLTGYMAHGCVSSTAREATVLGYDVVVAEDAIGQRDMQGVPAAEVKKVAMIEMHDMFGTVVKSATIN